MIRAQEWGYPSGKMTSLCGMYERVRTWYMVGQGSLFDFMTGRRCVVL